VLGARTVTDDAEAPLLERCDVQGLESSTIQSCLTPFVGETLQAPPAYAAVRQGGQKLYQLARRGVEAQPEPRRVTVHAIDLLAWTPPQLRIRVRCGPGTYIRALARDIGGALGVGGYLHALRRTASGGFTLADCHHLEALPDAAAVRAAAEPPDRAVLSWPALIMTGDQTRAARDGRPVSVEGPDGYGQVRLYGPDGWLVALGERRGERIRPVRVFPPEAEGGRKA
jgi:tRNA pseudouridine55 synthase